MVEDDSEHFSSPLPSRGTFTATSTITERDGTPHVPPTPSPRRNATCKIQPSGLGETSTPTPNTLSCLAGSTSICWCQHYAGPTSPLTRSRHGHGGRGRKLERRFFPCTTPRLASPYSGGHCRWGRGQHVKNQNQNQTLPLTSLPSSVLHGTRRDTSGFDVFLPFFSPTRLSGSATYPTGRCITLLFSPLASQR